MLRDLLEAAGYTNDGPGAAVVVRSADGLAHQAAIGRAQPGAEFTTGTVSYLGSVAKQMVGVCTAMLVVDGRLDVGSTMRHWLPEMPSWADAVRIRHLVHHTGGLPSDPELEQRIAAEGEPRWDSAAVLSALTAVPDLQFKPGSRFQYCNAGYISLVAILERATGTPFVDLANRMLFGPLRMRHTRFCDRADAIPTSPAIGQPAPEDQDRWPLPLSLGDGGAWSTVKDLQRWNEAMEPSGALGDQVRAIIGTPGQLDDGRSTSYAWGIHVSTAHGLLMHSHGGNWLGGWTAKVIRLPGRGISIAALSNDGCVPRMVELTDSVLRRVIGRPS